MEMSESSRINATKWIFKKCEQVGRNPIDSKDLLEVLYDNIDTFRSNDLVLAAMVDQESSTKQAEYDAKKARVVELESQGFS